MKKYWIKWKGQLGNRLNGLSRKQKLVLIFGLLGLFVAVDFCYIWSGFSRSAKDSLPEIEHIKLPPVLKQNANDSINVKSFEYGNEKE